MPSLPTNVTPAPRFGSQDAQWWRPKHLVGVKKLNPAFAEFGDWKQQDGIKARLGERIAFLYEIDARMRGYHLFGVPYAWLGPMEYHIIQDSIWFAENLDEKKSSICKLRDAIKEMGGWTYVIRRKEAGRWSSPKIRHLNMSPMLLLNEDSNIAFQFNLTLEPLALWHAMEPHVKNGEFIISRRRFVAWVKNTAKQEGVQQRINRSKTGERSLSVNWDWLEYWDRDTEWIEWWEAPFKTQQEKMKPPQVVLSKAQLTRVRDARAIWMRELSVIGVWSREFGALTKKTQN